MTLIAATVVRVGVLVERTASEHRPFVYSMFFCRQRDPGTKTMCPIADWAREEVSCIPYHGFNALFRRMKVGERRRYWMHLRNGFTIKDGNTDLKEYVYAAAYELLARYAPPKETT